MNEAQFAKQRQADWQRLSELCDASQISPTFLRTGELLEFVRVYRRCSTDLSVLRTEGAHPRLIEEINAIVGRAYGILHRSPRKSFEAAIREGVATVARTVRKRANYVFVAIALTFTISIATSITMDLVPSSHDIFIPPGQQENVDTWLKGMPKRQPEQSALMTGFYAGNNPLAALETASAGLWTFGLGSLQAIYANSVGMGALGHEMAKAGKLHVLLIQLLPHGLSELSGFMISAGAGLMMGFALLNPGRRTRGQALTEAGKDAIIMVAASVVMMYIAAPIEGWFSFDPSIPLAVKFGVAVVEATGWFLFWTGYARTEEEGPKFGALKAWVSKWDSPHNGLTPRSN